MKTISIDSFSGLAADLKPAMRTPGNVLHALRKDPHISTWDFDSPWLSCCIDTLIAQGKIKEVDAEYPWYRFEVLT